MNAYELTKELSEFMTEDKYTDLDKTIFKTCNMLRQQADELEAFKLNFYNTGYTLQLRDKDETIRQQADRIAELEKGGEIAGRFYWESVVDGHVMAVPSEGTPHYNKDDFPLYTTPQIKELSDEEIEQIAIKWYVGSRILPIGFARAILKKASEK